MPCNQLTLCCPLLFWVSIFPSSALDKNKIANVYSGLEEAQAGIKSAGRNIKNLRYADDTTLMAESEEELKSLLMKVKEESEKAGLKLNIQKLRSWEKKNRTKIMAPCSSLQGKKMGKKWKQ